MRELRNGLQVGIMGLTPFQEVLAERLRARPPNLFAEKGLGKAGLDASSEQATISLVETIASGLQPEGLTKEGLVAAMPAACDLISRLLQEEMGKACRAAVDGRVVDERVARQRSATLLWRLDRAVESAGDVRRIPHELVPAGFCARWGEEAGRRWDTQRCASGLDGFWKDWIEVAGTLKMPTSSFYGRFPEEQRAPPLAQAGPRAGELWEARDGRVVRVLAEATFQFADVLVTYWRGGKPSPWGPKMFERVGGPGWARRADACRRCGAPTVRKHGYRGPFMSCATWPTCRETRDAGDLALVDTPLRGVAGAP